MFEFVLEWGLGGALGVDGGWLPLPTRPQRFCDPASLVYAISTVSYSFWTTIYRFYWVSFFRIIMRGGMSHCDIIEHLIAQIVIIISVICNIMAKERLASLLPIRPLKIVSHDHFAR